MLRTTLVGMLGIAGLAIGCTTGSPATREPNASSLVVVTGDSCARGCVLDRPLLVGAEIVADVLAAYDLDGVEARAIDPDVATAWIEPVRVCCAPGEGATCRRMDVGEARCEGRDSERRRLVIRGLRVGRTAIELRGANGEAIETFEVGVEDAAFVEAVPVLVPMEELPDDVVGGPIDGGTWIDRRIEQLDLRVGESARIRLIAHSPAGVPLFADGAAVARIADPQIAHVGPATAICSGEVAHGPRVVIDARAPGVTALTLEAGSATRMLEVVVSGACDDVGHVEPTSVACESDADCVPSGCCHPTTCVAAAQAPSCGDAICTLECRAGTLDCGGRCLCLEGRCAAYIPTLADPSCGAQDDDASDGDGVFVFEEEPATELPEGPF